MGHKRIDIGPKRKAPPNSTEGFLEYAATASDRALGNMQLGRLWQSQHIHGRIADEIKEWVKCEAEALFVSWVIECRRTGPWRHAALKAPRPGNFEEHREFSLMLASLQGTLVPELAQQQRRLLKAPKKRP